MLRTDTPALVSADISRSKHSDTFPHLLQKTQPCQLLDADQPIAGVTKQHLSPPATGPMGGNNPAYLHPPAGWHRPSRHTIPTVGKPYSTRINRTLGERSGALAIDDEEICSTRFTDSIQPDSIPLHVVIDPPERLDRARVHAIPHDTVALVRPDVITVGVAAVGGPLVVGARATICSSAKMPPRLVDQTGAVLHHPALPSRARALSRFGYPTLRPPRPPEWPDPHAGNPFPQGRRQMRRPTRPASS